MLELWRLVVVVEILIVGVHSDGLGNYLALLGELADGLVLGLDFFELGHSICVAYLRLC